jgi:uncharacterized protein YjcR
MEYDPATVGKRIEELLNASGMKYMDFAKRLNRSPSAVSAWISRRGINRRADL